MNSQAALSGLSIEAWSGLCMHKLTARYENSTDATKNRIAAATETCEALENNIFK